MYILLLEQDNWQTELAVFNSIQQGREFLEKIEGYSNDGEEEFIDPSKLPLYIEIDYNGHIVPLTKFMFPLSDPVNIYWKQIPYLAEPGSGLVDATTRVDAYHVNNEDLKSYIYSREKHYDQVKSKLEKENYEVTRSFLGSEDGEAILYRKKGSDEWHFYHHLDPTVFEVED